MSAALPPRPLALLDSAILWTHGCLQPARSSSLACPTPCRGWDLGQLLVHLDESLAAIGEAAELGRVAMAPRPVRPDPSQLVDRIVERACRTRAAWRARVTSAPLTIGDLGLGRDTVALVGALEIAVHGWDVAWATGRNQALPGALAVELLDVALAVVTAEERAHRFAPALPEDLSAPAGDRLLAHLGRTPR